jgi:hypothetical protein
MPFALITRKQIWVEQMHHAQLQKVLNVQSGLQLEIFNLEILQAFFGKIEE